MRGVRAAASLLVAGQVATLAACKRDGHKPEVTMHRQRAGTPGADGWLTADSTGGQFRVSLPGPFNDFEMAADLPDGAPATVYVVATVARVRDASGASPRLKLTAACTTQRDGHAPALPPVDGGGHHEITVAGMRGFELDPIQTDKGMERARAFRDDHRLCVLQVDAPDGGTPPADVSRRFFDSFQPTDP